jgi:DNA-binding transcriptional LysR family regulator
MNPPRPFDALSIAQLRLFDQVAQRQSFSAAARALSLSQPAASRSIAAMEAALGGALFHRSTRRVRPTELGETLLAKLEPLLRQFAELDALTAGRAEGLTGRLRVAAPGAFGRRFVAPVAERFLASHPGVTIELLLADGRADLLEQGVDVAVRIGDALQPGARTRVIGRSRARLVAAPTLVAGRAVATLADVLALPAVMPTDGGAAVLKALGGATARGAPSARLRANDVDALWSAVVAGVGVSVLPAWRVDDDLRAGRLVALLPALPLPESPIRLVFLGAQRPRRLVRAFAETFAASLPADVLAGTGPRGGASGG